MLTQENPFSRGSVEQEFCCWVDPGQIDLLGLLQLGQIVTCGPGVLSPSCLEVHGPVPAQGLGGVAVPAQHLGLSVSQESDSGHLNPPVSKLG